MYMHNLIISTYPFRIVPPRAPTKTIGGAPPRSMQTNSGAAVPTSRFTLTEVLDRLLEVMPT